MKRKGITFYTVLISVVFAFCIGFFAYNIIYEYRHGEIRTKKTSDFALSSIEKNGESSDFSRIFENLDDYSSVYIEKDGNILFAYPNIDAKYAEETKFVDVYRNSVAAKDGNFSIVLSLYTLRPSAIFYYARFSFTAILVATLFSVILIFYYTLTSKNSDEKDEKSDISDENGNKDFSEYGSPETNRNQDTFSDTKANENLNNPENAEENPENAEENTSESVNENSIADEKNVPEKTGLHSAAENDEKQDSENGNILSYQIPQVPFSENEAENIFSQKTGLCKESQLKPRLDSELIQAASDEQDLSLVALKIPGLEPETPVLKNISSLLLENSSRNLVFERGGDGFFVIRKDMEIEKAEEEAENLLGKINAEISETGMKCLIGISSRNTRILSSERLIKEAEEALKHSEEDAESPITAFHVDIEKYREFISQS